VQYDVRLIERHIKDGRFTIEELAAHKKSLPDVAEKAETIPDPRHSREQAGSN
jgi:hypothetical protein